MSDPLADVPEAGDPPSLSASVWSSSTVRDVRATASGPSGSSASAAGYAGPPPPPRRQAIPRQLSVNSSSANPSDKLNAQQYKTQRIVPPRRSSSAVVVPVEGTMTPDTLFRSASKDPSEHTSHLLSKMPHTPKEYLLPPSHTELTPLRAHYLKRELVGGQLARELDGLGNPDALSVIGWPFTKTTHAQTQLDAYSALTNTARTTAGGNGEEEEDLPLLRFFFHQFVMTFPFLSDVDCDIFYGKKLQPFIGSFMARNISMNEEREEETGVQTKRHKLAGKAEKHLGLLISSAVKLNDNGGREEVVRIVDVKPTTASSASPPPVPPKDGKHKRTTSTSSASSLNARYSAPPSASNPRTPVTPTTANSQFTNVTNTSGATEGSTVGFSVNVVGVRSITTKHRLGRKSKHEEFLVKTSRAGFQDAYVARRYGDFVGLSQLLRTEFPDYDIRPPPAKDRRGVDASSATQAANQVQAGSVLSPASVSSAAAQDSDNVSLSDNSAPVTLSRERNRLTLRAYLRDLMTNQDVANSQALQAFLLNGTTTLTPAEEADAARREELDRHREAESAKFKSEVSNRVRELEQHLRGFKDELVKKDGLTRVFATIRETKDLKDLPVEYQKVMEWARISLASTIYQLFLGTDQSSAIFTQFKRVNGLMPYFMMRQILKISNPVSMIRAALDLFLARPFGSPSLLQRMFSSGLEAEVKELKEDMIRVQEKIEDPVMCERVKRYIYAPRAIQNRYREEAKNENMDIITIILRSRDDNMPNLSPSSIMRVHRASIAHRQYLDWVATLEDPEEEDEGPDNDDAWLYEDLHVFMRMCMRIRDKEQMLELIFEGNTSDLLKDIVTIFYEPLAKVYKAANISDSLYDLQMFITDLIKTVEAAEASVTSAAIDPQKTVTIFMDLVQRHEGAFYHFVHSVHSKGEDLFDGLMRWIELFLNFIREGLNPEGITLDFLLPQGEGERQAIMQEIDAVIDYHRALKIAHHERLRRRLIKGEVAGAASYTTGSGVVGSPGQVGFGSQNEGEQAAFVDGVLNGLHMTGVADDIDDLNAEEDEDSEDEYDHRSDDFVDAQTGDDPDSHLASQMAGASIGQDKAPAWMNQAPSAPIQIVEVVYLPPEAPNSAKSSKKGGKRPKATKIVEPELVEIPKLVPIFTEMLRPSLQTAQRVQILRNNQKKGSKHVNPLGAVLRR